MSDVSGLHWKDVARIGIGSVLRHMPGPVGLLNRRRYRKGMQSVTRRRFETALSQLERGLINIDLGANLGIYTRKLASHGHVVHAFEPDPWTAAQLRSNVADLSGIHIHEAAAGTAPGEIEMYRENGYEEDPKLHSTGTSIFADKRNMSSESAFTVPVIDIPDFLSSLEADIGILKIDIEGAEVPLLEVLFDHPVMERIQYLFVETHDHMIPALQDRTWALVRRAERMRQPYADLNWG